MKHEKAVLYAADINELNMPGMYERVVMALDGERREKVLKYGSNLKGAMQSAGAGLLLEYVLKSHGIFEHDMCFSEKGKPYLAGRRDVFFNLSHSNNMVICAVSPVEVGCDIEFVKSGRTRIAQRYFTKEEQRFAQISERHFYRMWTLKESFIKATGRGLGLRLDSFEISVKEEGISVRQAADEREFAFREYPCFSDYCCSICIAYENVAKKDAGIVDMPDMAEHIEMVSFADMLDANG